MDASWYSWIEHWVVHILVENYLIGFYDCAVSIQFVKFLSDQNVKKGKGVFYKLLLYLPHRIMAIDFYLLLEWKSVKSNKMQNVL